MTRSETMRRYWRENRGHMLSLQPVLKLDTGKVKAIRNQYAAGIKMAALAAEYGVSDATIYKVVRGKAWA